jgi:hypothetical protein
MEFEIHVTVKDLKIDEKESFVEFCKSEGVKPVMIVLDQGDYINQPMISAVIRHDSFQEANEEIETLATKMQNKGFSVVRKKVEISPKKETYFYEPVVKNSKPYYEWHGKVLVDDVDMLKKLCEGQGGRISRNSLNADGKKRFITVRDYEGSKPFYERVENIHRILDANDIGLLKEEYELCIYDSREGLDSGWIAQ